MQGETIGGRRGPGPGEQAPGRPGCAARLAVACGLLIQSFMRTFFKKLEALWTAVAFAEEGDVETARQVLREAEKLEQPPRERAEPARLSAVPVASAMRGSRA